MNKLLIVLLAICLVSVHAFVKRDAPEKSDDALAKIQKEFEGIGDKMKAVLDPEAIKKGFNELVDSINKGFNSLSPKQEEPKQ